MENVFSPFIQLSISNFIIIIIIIFAIKCNIGEMFQFPRSIPGVFPNSTLSRPGRDGFNAPWLLEAGTESSVVELWYTCA